MSEIACVAAASLVRDGDWVEFGHDDGGDPKWSHQATAFYVEIAPYVLSGTVSFEGEDGSFGDYVDPVAEQ